MNWLAAFGGRYAAFVDTAYAVAAVVFAAMVLDTLLRARRWRLAAEAAEALSDGSPETDRRG